MIGLRRAASLSRGGAAPKLPQFDAIRAAASAGKFRQGSAGNASTVQQRPRRRIERVRVLIGHHPGDEWRERTG